MLTAASGNLNRNATAAVGSRLFSSEDKPKTLALQDQLLNLPLPEIKDTISKFLLTTKPHLSESEYQTTAKKLLQVTYLKNKPPNISFMDKGPMHKHELMFGYS